MDLRIKSMPFEFNGKTYTLCCNMNVLADVQESYNGNLLAALRSPGSIKASTTFLCAMLNDSAETNGWPERYTVRQIGRMLSGSPENVKELATTIGGFIRSALTQKDETEAVDSSKN